MPIDFAALELGPKPNQYLVCPAAFCAKAQTVHREAPVYPVTVAALKDAFLDVVAAQPRVSPGPVDTTNLQFQFVQRTALLRFPDTVDVRFIPLGEDKATLAIYSRSKYGYSDMGVNKRRIDNWLDALDRELAAKRPAG